MIDWTRSMKQTFEFYVVDPFSWKDKSQVDFVESCKINRDESNDSLGSVTIDCNGVVDECYIRAYLVVNQNGETLKVPLSTFLVQTPSEKYDGKNMKISLDAYTPLIELKEDKPPLGYSILKGQGIMPVVNVLCSEHMRAPVVGAKSNESLYTDFVANDNDTWLTFIRDLAKTAKFEMVLDPDGRLLFEPIKDIASLQPVWTYDDGNSSILYPSVTHKRDLYGMPNVVEVVYSNNNETLYSRIENNDPQSPISTVSRGRTILYRVNNPKIPGKPTQNNLDLYAQQLLRNLSCLEHTITYKHGYCPTRVGDCVFLNYEKAGLKFVKAKIISQSISCEIGCPVEETAVYTTKLWR